MLLGILASLVSHFKDIYPTTEEKRSTDQTDEAGPSADNTPSNDPTLYFVENAPQAPTETGPIRYRNRNRQPIVSKSEVDERTNSSMKAKNEAARMRYSRH